MNDPTRQLLVLIRKIRLDVRQAIRELHTSDAGYEEYSPDDDADAAEKEGDILSAIKAIQDADSLGEAKKYALDHRRYRLEWKAYRAARLTLIFLVAYTGLTLVVAYQSIRSADATKKSADTAATQLELTQRPWVYVKDAEVASPLVIDKDGAHVTLNITLHNSGPSPAVGVSLVPRLYVFPAQESTIPPVERLCDAHNYFGPGITHGLMIFPNSDSPLQSMTVTLGNNEIMNGAHHGVIMYSPFICVLYRPTFRDTGPGYSSAIQYSFWPAIFVGKTAVIPQSALYMQRTGFFGESAH